MNEESGCLVDSEDCPQFSVAQYFIDDSYDYECRYVDIKTAVAKFNHLKSSVGAKIGTTKRVIVTDSGDCINLEWEYGKGITYPPELVGK